MLFAASHVGDVLIGCCRRTSVAIVGHRKLYQQQEIRDKLTQHLKKHFNQLHTCQNDTEKCTIDAIVMLLCMVDTHWVR